MHPLSSSPPTLTYSRFAQVDCTILKFSVGGTRLLNPALFRAIYWKKCYPSEENIATGLKTFKRFPVSGTETVCPGPVGHFNA